MSFIDLYPNRALDPDQIPSGVDGEADARDEDDEYGDEELLHGENFRIGCVGVRTVWLVRFLGRLSQGLLLERVPIRSSSSPMTIPISSGRSRIVANEISGTVAMEVLRLSAAHL